MCSPVCSSTVIGCTYDIPSGIYNMYVYDIEEENTLSDEWAISSTNITVTGLEQTYPSLKVSCPVCSVSMVTALGAGELLKNIYNISKTELYQFSVTHICYIDIQVSNDTSCLTAALGGDYY